MCVDPVEKKVAQFFNKRNWVAVDAAKFKKDVNLLRYYKKAWPHVSPNVTPTQMRPIHGGSKETQNPTDFDWWPGGEKQKQWRKLLLFFLKCK